MASEKTGEWRFVTAAVHRKGLERVAVRHGDQSGDAPTFGTWKM